MAERYCFKCRRRRQSPCGPICAAFGDDTAEMVERTQAAQDHIALLRKIQCHDNTA